MISGFYIPAIILFSSFTVNLIISILVASKEAFYTGGIFSIVGYILAAGIIVVVRTFPFAVGLSIRRADYFIGSVVMGFIVSIIFTTVIFLMGQLEVLTNGWGNNLHFFHLPYLNDGTLSEQFLVYLIILIHLFFSGFLISSFAKRFGGKGMFLLALVLFLLGSIAVYLIHNYGLWSVIFQWFSAHTALQLAYWLLAFVFIYLLASFLLLRKASV